MEERTRQVIDGAMRRLEACQSPVWDTALAVIGLTDAGVAADDPALIRAANRREKLSGEYLEAFDKALQWLGGEKAKRGRIAEQVEVKARHPP